MALQLGALRDALLAANVPAEKASAAAEEVAGYENRLTHLTTLVQLAVGLLVVLLGSQFVLWAELGKLNAGVTRTETQVTEINHKLNHQ